MSTLEDASKDFKEIISKKFDDTVIQAIVKKYSPLDNISVKEIKYGSESKKGDSYLSAVCRFSVKITGHDNGGQTKEDTVPVIVKSLPKNIARRKTFRSLDYFKNEIIFYNKVWPSLKAYYESHTSHHNSPDIIPGCLASCADGENNFLALEDLSYKGYRCIRRDVELDLEHASIILKALARFHGIGLSFKARQPERFDEIASSLRETVFIEKHRSWYQKFQSNLINVALDAVEKELPPQYLEKTKQYLNKDFFGKICQKCAERNTLSVVTHGDVWIPNFLFKYENDKPVHVAIIDFQLARYTTLSTDIVFFLYVCLGEDLLQNHWPDLIQEYHKNLVSTVQELGSSAEYLTLELLQEDIKRSGFFGVAMAVEAVTMALLDDDEVADLDKIQGDEAVPIDTIWVVKPLETTEKRQRLANVFKHAIDNGFM